MSPTDAAPAPTPHHPLLDALWAQYVRDVPHAVTFARLAGQPFHNDHIALRTLARPGGGIAMMAAVFERLGWRRAGAYDFPDVHLTAIHLSQPGLPRVFVSELHAERLPADARAVLARLPADAPPPDDTTALAGWFVPPAPPTAADLDVVARASQYGAWLLTFGRKVNHFTASVPDVELWQRKLVEAGVPMKSEIEGERGGPLRQTATHACPANVTLADGSVRALPYAYLEIAQRGEGFDGFLAPQARQLFDMTAR